MIIPAGDGQRGDQSSFQVVNPTQLAAAIHIILQRAAAFDVCIIPETGELGRSKAHYCRFSAMIAVATRRLKSFINIGNNIYEFG